MALAQSLSVSLCDTRVFASTKYPYPASAQFLKPTLLPARASFATGSPLVIRRNHERKTACKAMPVSIRCEQNTKGGNGLDVWLGRGAMIGFAVALSVEIATGKGLLENFGVSSPLPTVALAVTALVGVLTAVFIFQSASEN
ncbi:stress enhanced protein 1, chloroplastic isoform X2 [Cicer arietinum]|uniref:Stress enhanced protein 1, chloroplastic isoform X2 n=1 Tax=Cicer arietinum TaxID=3827 RepID=A0A1S2XZJ0_CICAR|nr:stress enhanced protein 1, chloroplastic isoform X2 [Cicer arietinum]